jgi:hypothetical protein
MLAIYKFVNNNIKTETRPLNITTSQVEDIRYKFVGRFLDTSQESVNKATLQIPKITYEYTVTYRTQAEIDAAVKRKDEIIENQTIRIYDKF